MEEFKYKALEEGDTLVTDRKTAQIKVVFLKKKIDENGAVGPALIAILGCFALFFMAIIGVIVGLVLIVAAFVWYTQRQTENHDTEQEIGLLKIAYDF